MSVSLVPDALGGGSTIDIVMPPRALDGASGALLTAAQPLPAASAAVPATLRSSFQTQSAAPAVEITINTEGEQEALPLGSHLEGLTVQQMLDLDVDSLAMKIDRHHQHTKKAVLDHFMETKARLMQAQNDAVEEEKRKGAARLAAKEEELGLLKAELEATRGKSQHFSDLVGRSCDAFSLAKERQRTTTLKFQLFYAWREQALALKQRRRRAERAERWYSDVHLKRNVFRAWFREAMREHRITTNNRYIQEVDNTKRQIDAHYQSQIAELQ
ncbi:hypothetical protein GPECTOR_1g346 [Gonium pectorale]|uniref:Centrosomal protein POC5 n=1 Tax=Gonium pectorale TaxID=33097 RepID=A0A150H494_GONPE|nr:hypothetical protein GPECTOR_1g346 [Gonium pectorale]|eukprot:KXZ56390.1 hypothetical protein GPECTOR_1g346 [Gonium pectorale]